jgi:hypothetical protein
MKEWKPSEEEKVADISDEEQKEKKSSSQKLEEMSRKFFNILCMLKNFYRILKEEEDDNPLIKEEQEKKKSESSEERDAEMEEREQALSEHQASEDADHKKEDCSELIKKENEDIPMRDDMNDNLAHEKEEGKLHSSSSYGKRRELLSNCFHYNIEYLKKQLDSIKKLIHVENIQFYDHLQQQLFALHSQINFH